MEGLGKLLLTLDKAEIAYVKFILEGYDGLGILSTEDPHEATAMLTYPLERKALIDDLMSVLAKEGVLKEVQNL
ncbi:MAG: DUF4911 domain-containing protein [Deltaproteobacteria bacterium]|nr:DUF4911 domain-containing protein [Deltaproteobacteria bacterium]